MAGPPGGNGSEKSSADLTIEILRQIRDEMGGLRRDNVELRESLNARIDGLRESLNARIDQTNERLDQTNQRLGRVEQGLLDLGSFMRELA